MKTIFLAIIRFIVLVLLGLAAVLILIITGLDDIYKWIKYNKFDVITAVFSFLLLCSLIAFMIYAVAE